MAPRWNQIILPMSGKLIFTNVDQRAARNTDRSVAFQAAHNHLHIPTILLYRGLDGQVLRETIKLRDLRRNQRQRDADQGAQDHPISGGKVTSWVGFALNARAKT